MTFIKNTFKNIRIWDIIVAIVIVIQQIQIQIIKTYVENMAVSVFGISVLIGVVVIYKVGTWGLKKIELLGNPRL